MTPDLEFKVAVFSKSNMAKTTRDRFIFLYNYIGKHNQTDPIIFNIASCGFINISFAFCVNLRNNKYLIAKKKKMMMMMMMINIFISSILSVVV